MLVTCLCDNFVNLLTKVQQSIGEETNGDLDNRRQEQNHVLDSTLSVIITVFECFRLIVLGACGFGKQTVGEGLALLCIEL